VILELLLLLRRGFVIFRQSPPHDAWVKFPASLLAYIVVFVLMIFLIPQYCKVVSGVVGWRTHQVRRFTCIVGDEEPAAHQPRTKQILQQELVFFIPIIAISLVYIY
jgi:hypothetical protein